MSATPPSGDTQKAEEYLVKMIPLIEADKLFVAHTDLSKFDPSTLQDHYRLDLKEYTIEVSHSKNPDTGRDSFIMLFTNISQVETGESGKVILAYLHLTEEQFRRFADASINQLQRIKAREEEKRLNEALKPIDEVFDEISSNTSNETLTDDVIEEKLPAYS